MAGLEVQRSFRRLFSGKGVRRQLADCTHSESCQKAALDSVTQSDSHQKQRSLTWKPIKFWNPEIKANWSAKRPPLKPKDIWAIRIHLQNEHRVRDLAMFNLAIDSKLRGCDLVNLHVRDVAHGNQVLPRAMVLQRKTQRPVQFELTEPTRSAVSAWIEMANLRAGQYLFPSRLAKSPNVSTRQYARIVHQWVAAIGLDSTVYGTHTMRRTKVTLITSEPRTYGPSNSCSVIASWRVPFDTLGSRWMMHWRSRSRPRSRRPADRCQIFPLGIHRTNYGAAPGGISSDGHLLASYCQ
jgi:hypothetical protein